MMHARYREHNLDPLTVVIDRKLYLLYTGVKVTVQEPGKTWWTGVVTDVNKDRNMVLVDYSGGTDLGGRDEKSWHPMKHIVCVNDPDQEPKRRTRYS